MKPNLVLLTLSVAASALGQGVWAQGAPGTDPIVLNAPVRYLAMHTAPFRASEGLDQNTGMPSGLSAKIARIEAKTYAELAGQDGTIYTERDVISRQTGNALERTCTTDVASNTITPAVGPSGRYGPGTGGDQIAVLRGDVVTICK